ncbi:MAG: LuxR C-terminal-related transcriptional regulator [Sphingomonas sp.]
MLATDTRGRFLWCSPLAERAIARIAPGWSKDDVTLPLQFRMAIERLLARRAMGVSSVRIEQPLGTLELVLIAQYRENEVLIRLNELNPDEHAAQLKLRLQITDREAEVLLWLSYGKSSGDISDVLSISPRTVQKHLERIFEKLGVETRAAAAAMAIRAIGQ